MFIQSVVTLTALIAADNADATARIPVPAELIAAVGEDTVDPNELSDWHKQAEATHPRQTQGQGCFGVDYPSTTWKKQVCTKAPEIPLPPVHRPKSWDSEKPFTGDYAAANSALQANVKGWVPGSTLHSLTDSLAGTGYWSGQLNTNFFSTPACSGSSNPSGCLGWQQFVYSQGGNSAHGLAYIQYWLINYNASCPSGWNTYSTGSGNDCWKNSPSSQSGSAGGYSNAGVLSIQGQASASSGDSMTAHNIFSVINVYTGNVLNLASGWYDSEYNIFGYGNGSTVSAAAGDSFKIAIDTASAASCISQSYTAETSNLNRGPCCLPPSGTGIRFQEAVSSTPTSCP